MLGCHAACALGSEAGGLPMDADSELALVWSPELLLCLHMA